MPTCHTQPQSTWRDRFTERELRLIANCRHYAENDPAGLPGHQLLLIISRLTDTLDTLPLHEVSPDLPELLSDYFDEKWQQGKLSEVWGEEDEVGLLQLLAPLLKKSGEAHIASHGAYCSRIQPGSEESQGPWCMGRAVVPFPTGKVIASAYRA